MHIEFRLPTGAGGMAAGYFNANLKRRVTEWAAAHNVEVKYFRHQSYRSCFEFTRPADYTLFALSWVRQNQWDCYEIIED